MRALAGRGLTTTGTDSGRPAPDGAAPETAWQALSARFKSSSTSSGLKVYKPTTPGASHRSDQQQRPPCLLGPTVASYQLAAQRR